MGFLREHFMWVFFMGLICCCGILVKWSSLLGLPAGQLNQGLADASAGSSGVALASASPWFRIMIKLIRRAISHEKEKRHFKADEGKDSYQISETLLRYQNRFFKKTCSSETFKVFNLQQIPFHLEQLFQFLLPPPWMPVVNQFERHLKLAGLKI